jgi:hypothetical protein
VFLKNLVSHESIECFKKQIFSLGFLGQEGLLSVLARFKVGRQVFEKGDSFECWQKVETGCDKVCGYRGQSTRFFAEGRNVELQNVEIQNVDLRMSNLI